MKRLRDIGIKNRAVIVLMATNFAAVLIVATVVFSLERRELAETAETDLRNTAGVLKLAFSGTDDRLESREIDQRLEYLASVQNIRQAYVFDEHDAKISGYHRAGEDAEPVKMREPGFHAVGGGGAWVEALELGGGKTGTLILVSDLSGGMGHFREIIPMIGIATLIWFFITLAIAGYLNRAVAAPVRAVVRSMEAITESGDYGERLPVATGDEIGRLTKAFNSLLIAVEQRDIQLAQRERHLLEELQERRRAEQFARKEETNLRNIILSSPIAMFLVDVDGKVLLSNEAFRALFGYNGEDLPDMEEWWTRSYPEPVDRSFWKSRWKEQVAKRRSNGQPLPPYDSMIRTRAGDFRFCKVSTAQLGERVLTAFTDLTERQKVETLLRHEKRLSDSIISSLPGLFFLIDATGNLLRVNRQAEAFFELIPEQPIRRNLYDFVGEQDRDILREFIATRSLEADPEIELRLLDAQGRSHTFLLRATRLHKSDGLKLVCAGVDISERQRLEQSLRQRQKLEVVGRLAGGVAHDFNNVLQAIKGFTRIALEAATGEPERTECLEEVIKAAERAAGITRQLLVFGRRQDLEKTQTNLNALINEQLKLLRLLTGDKIEISVEPAEDEPLVFCDPTQIEQVVMNLCVNARDAMPDGGRIRIALDVVDLDPAFCRIHSWARPGRFVCIGVEDTGTGIEESVLNRIFEPFFSTKTRDLGSGLGLSVVYGIVEQHEGMLQVDSELGKGTRFQIYLPADPAPREDATIVEEVSETDGAGETILVAEDEEAVRLLCGLVLKKAGYRVLEATDGASAIEIYKSHRKEVSLLIFDAMMPVKGGLDAYREIAALDPAVPVIFCSGYTNPFAASDANLPEGAQLIQKPYSPDKLLRLVRQVLASRKQSVS